MGFLSGKRALIVGVASDRSIAWGIAQAMHREGAELAFTYQNERFKDRVGEMAREMGSELTSTIACSIGTHLAKLETAPVNKRFSEGESHVSSHRGLGVDHTPIIDDAGDAFARFTLP